MQKEFENLNVKIGSIVIDCTNFDKMLSFWQDALHYVPKAPAKGGWVILRDPDQKSPNVSLNLAPIKHKRRNRMHVDLYADDRETEVERLLKLGATWHRQRYAPTDDFRVLKDPDGNLFCVVQKKTSGTKA